MIAAKTCAIAPVRDSAAMLRRTHAAMGVLLALAACATDARLPADLAARFAEAPADASGRLWLEGDRIAAAAIAVGPGALPPAVRTTIDAVAPRGELVFQGREWSSRGEGFRIEKRYRENGNEHTRSVLVADDGRVLERSHSVPIAEVPQDVLAVALQRGHQVDEARIVSGAEREEHWSCTVTNRMGWSFVVDIGLDRALLRTRRRVQVRLES